MTLPPLHPFHQQEVSIIDPSFSPLCIDYLDHFSTQNSSMFVRLASSPAQAIFAQTPQFPESQNLLLISDNVRTFSDQQYFTVSDTVTQVSQVHHDPVQSSQRQVYVAPRPNRFNDYTVSYDYSVIPRPSPPSLSSTGFSAVPSHQPDVSFLVPPEPGHQSSFPFYPAPASVLSSSFGMSDRSDRSSSLTNTIDAIGWTGFLQQSIRCSDNSLTTSSTLHTTDSNDDNGTRLYSENSATGPFYNWCFLQLCGVAIDVSTCLAEVLPLSVDQALSLTPVSRRRSLDPADHALLVQRSALFLHGLYRPHSSSRAKIVYVCALAMTFLFQPETRDNRMVLEFQRRIGELSPLLGLHNIVGDSDLQQLVMDYFRMVYHHDLCYHTRFSVLSSYATWFNEGQASFAIFCLTVMVLSYVTITLSMMPLNMGTSQIHVIRTSDSFNRCNSMQLESMDGVLI